MNKYTFNIEKMFKVKEVESKDEFQTFKSDLVTLSFSKKSEMLSQLTFKKEDKQLVFFFEGEQAKETFRFDMKNGKMVDDFPHKDEELLTFANAIYP